MAQLHSFACDKSLFLCLWDLSNQMLFLFSSALVEHLLNVKILPHKTGKVSVMMLGSSCFTELLLLSTPTNRFARLLCQQGSFNDSYQHEWSFNHSYLPAPIAESICTTWSYSWSHYCRWVWASVLAYWLWWLRYQHVFLFTEVITDAETSARSVQKAEWKYHNSVPKSRNVCISVSLDLQLSL